MQAADRVYSPVALVFQEGDMQSKDVTKKIVSEHIKARMADLHMIQDDLEELTGIKQPQLSTYIAANAAPTVPNLIKLAQALQCTAGYLLGLEKDPKPPEPPDPLSSLGEDERRVLEQYRSRRVTLQNEVINESITKLTNPLREQVKRIIARVLAEQGKFDNRRDNP